MEPHPDRRRTKGHKASVEANPKIIREVRIATDSKPDCECVQSLVRHRALATTEAHINAAQPSAMKIQDHTGFPTSANTAKAGHASGKTNLVTGSGAVVAPKLRAHITTTQLATVTSTGTCL